jgi:hypothetical protein
MAPRGAHAARYPGRVSLRRDRADLSVQRWLENGRECGVGAKEVAALTPLIALATAI